MKKQRAPALTPERESLVVELLDGWEGLATWAAVIDRVKQQTGIEYSRFTFGERPRIASAFEARKLAIRHGRGQYRSLRSPNDERLKAANAYAQRLSNKVERLEQENQRLLEQFVTWAVNAERKGVTIDMLNMSLPKPPRDRTKAEE